jgi:membrane protein
LSKKKYPEIIAKPMEALLAKSKRTGFPGGQGATFYHIGHLFFKNIRDLRLGERTAAISFNFLLGIPPSLIFLFSLMPFLSMDSVQVTIINALHLLMPNHKLFESAQGIIIDFMQTKRRDLLSFGFLTTVFVSSNGVMGLLRSFDRKSPALIERSGLARRWKSIKITLVIMLVIIISIVFLILQSNFLNNYFPNFIGSHRIIKIISWISLVFIIYITVCIIYKYGPSSNSKFRFFSPGATFSTILFVLVSYGFFFIAAHFLNYNKVYGSIGTLMMLMAWMFATGFVMLIGFELNLSIAMYSMNTKEKDRE